MVLRVREFNLRRADVKLRMPFRYGIATMTEGPVVFVRLGVEVGGRFVSGISSDLLPPKWFTKVLTKPIDDEIADIRWVILVSLISDDPKGNTFIRLLHEWSNE